MEVLKQLASASLRSALDRLASSPRPTLALPRTATVRRLDTPPYQFALPDEQPIRGLFDRALDSDEGARIALYDAVGRLVTHAKRDQVPIERVLVALKEIVRATQRPGRAHSAQAEPPPELALLGGLVRWAIEYYYGSPTPN
ncbi:MAG: hypothetical protein NVS4B3_16430 [Gemmatimonadaceae bacterium]